MSDHYIYANQQDTISGHEPTNKSHQKYSYTLVSASKHSASKLSASTTELELSKSWISR